MKEQDKFIREYLDEVVSKFKKVKCAYEFDSFDSTYVIKIEPKKDFNKVKNFLFKEKNIIKEFAQKYPFYTMTFITNDDFIDLNNIEYEVEGALFNIWRIYSSKLQVVDIHKNFIKNLLNHDEVSLLKSNINVNSDFFSNWDDINEINFEDNILVSSEKEELSLHEDSFFLAA